MKFMIIWQIAGMIYSKILRDLLVKAVSDPDEEWDDVVLKIVDDIFNYGE